MSRRESVINHLDAAGRLIAEAIKEAEQVLDTTTEEEGARAPELLTYNALWRAAHKLAEVSVTCREKL